MHAFCAQARGRALQHERITIAQQARDIIVAAEYASLSLPLSMAAASASATGRTLPEAGSTAAEAGLNWGPEGDEGPLLATGTACSL